MHHPAAASVVASGQQNSAMSPHAIAGGGAMNYPNAASIGNACQASSPPRDCSRLEQIDNMLGHLIGGYSCNLEMQAVLRNKLKGPPGPTNQKQGEPQQGPASGILGNLEAKVELLRQILVSTQDVNQEIAAVL